MINHFSLLVINSLILSLFFGILLKEGVKEIVKLSAKLFIGMVGISLLIGWIFYPFPS